MIEVKDGTVTVSKSRTLTAKQKMTLGRMSPDRAQDYLFSILGLVKKRVSVGRLKSTSVDPLSRKYTDCVLDAQRASINPRNDHVPLNIARGSWVGVEIECFLPGQDDESECDDCCGTGRVTREVELTDDDGDGTGEYREEEEDCDSCGGSGRTGGSGDDARGDLRSAIRQAKLSRVTVKEDGSLESDEGIGVEVTMVYNVAHGHGKLQKLLEVLNKAGAFVNETCGLHVHLDMRHAPEGDAIPFVREAGARLGRCLPVLTYMVPDSRRENDYCKIGVSDFDGNRYYAVNLTSFDKFRTIEVRLHSGSVNFGKISNWIDLLRLIVFTPINSKVQSFQELIDVTSMPDSLVAYVESRLKKHGPEMLTANADSLNGEVA